MAYERLNLTTGDLLDAEVFRKIDDAIEELVGVEYNQSPNLWGLELTTSDMTNQYYMNGLPYESEAFGKSYPCTEKIYLKDYAPQGETRTIDLKRDTKYTFCSIPALPNGYDTPWGTSIAQKLFFYDESNAYLGTGFVSGSANTIIVPSTATHFRFNIHTFPTNPSKNISAVLSAMSKSLMVVEGAKIPEIYYGYGELIENPIGSVYKLVNDFYEKSPNLWDVKLSIEHLTGKYYMDGVPYTASTQFDANHQATEKIYLKKYAPEGAELVVDLLPGYTYRFYSIPALPNTFTTPWDINLSRVSRIFFYDASDNYLGHGFTDTSTIDTVQIPMGTVYFRFNVSKYVSTFPVVLDAMNDSLMVFKADIETPIKYTACGESHLKESFGSGGSSIETRPIFYNISNGIVDIISHYNQTHDLRCTMLNKGPNNIFDYGKFLLVPVTATGEVSNDISSDSSSWSWAGTDSHAPWVIKAINNADGDNVNDSGVHKSYFTGGNHGYDNTGSTTDNPATGRTATVKLYVDGKEVVNGSGYCNKVKVCWDNYIQAYNTTKVDGTGREVLREVHESIFDGYEWKEEINIYPLEEIVVSTWYGIQGIGLGGAWKKGYFQGAKEFEANRSLLDSSNGTMTGNSNSKTSNKFVGFDETKSFELEIDPDYDLGSGYLSNSTFKCFISGSKVYFWIIKTDKTLLPDTNYGLKAFYRFKPVTTD